MNTIKKYFKFIVILICCSFYCSVIVYAGQLNEIWGEIIKKYPAPIPTKTERKTFTKLYKPLFDNYPESLFQSEHINYEDVVNYSSYIKRHETQKDNEYIYHKKLQPYNSFIYNASKAFDVPEKIIGAVILQESSGNPKAKAKTSSAKGLMQTIDATFSFSRKKLLKHGIIIKDPYKPKDSIMAGTWYLSYVFELAKQDWPEYFDRSQLIMWEKALEYYYAGPVWGKNPKPIFHAYVNGKKIVIKKAYYSKKVLEYAMLL